MRNDSSLVRCLILGVLVTACGVSVGWAQLESIERKGSGATVPAPQSHQVVPAPNAPVDTSGVWFHLRHRDLPGAQAELERLQAENPGWQVPADLAAAMVAALHPATAVDTYEQQLRAAETAIRNHAKTTAAFEALFSEVAQRCDAAAAERLGRAYLEAGDAMAAQSWLNQAVAWARRGSAVQVAAAGELVRADAAVGEWETARQHVQVLPPGKDRDAVAKSLSDAAGAAGTAAAKSKDWTGAERFAALSESLAPSRVRVDLGWVALDESDPARAVALFASSPIEESRYGLVLALDRSGADLAALTAACAPLAERSPRISEACGNAFAAAALRAYNAKDWRSVIAWDSRASELGVSRSGTRLLAAWSYYRLGDNAAALAAFDAAAASEPTAGDGIAQVLFAQGRIGELKRRAAASPQIFAAYRRLVADSALIRQRAFLANSVAAPGTEGMAAPEATVGFFIRDKSGAAGADRISTLGGTVSAATVAGASQWIVGIETDHVHVGTPPIGAPIGFGTGTTERDATLQTPWLRWEHQNLDSAISVTLGTTPIGGAVGALPVVTIAGERDWDKLILNGSFHVASRDDSLLSMAGLGDGVTGASWGRVAEIGPQAGAVALFGGGLSAAVSAAVSELQGHNVIGNTRVNAAASVTYEMTPPGFAFLRVGPTYTFDHYRRNEYFFTFGNGGYYSPQASDSAGAFVDFLTQAGASWLAGGRMTVAWQYARQDAAPRYPLDDEGSRLPGQTQAQVGTDSLLRAAVLLGPQLILGAFGRVIYAPSGRDISGGLTLTIPFDGRRGLFSSDLPHFVSAP